MNIYLYWLVVSTPLKNEFVSWDYYPQYMENHKIHVPNHQPAIDFTPIHQVLITIHHY